jgi:hypothetical protein
LVRADLRESFRQPTATPTGRREQAKLVERRIVERLRHEYPDDVGAQIRQWEDEAQKSPRTFWRRLKEVDGGGDGGRTRSDAK